MAASYQGHPAVVIDIQRQPGANIVQTVAAIRDALPALRRAMPAAVNMVTVTDRTETIRASVQDVEFTLLLAIGLVVLVIFVFLRSWRATIIPAVALPLSLIGTFGIMSLCGYSLDNLSLMALTVATGFVVDDAIVMIENVVRYIEDGVKPLEAAYRGAAQIGFTIVSLTVSLIAVFIPLLFMTGVVGRLFSEFAVVLTVSVIVSAIVSLTLTPMMCGRLLKPIAEERPGWLSRLTEAGFQRMLAGYRRSLEWSLRHQGFVLLVAVATLFGTIGMYVIVPKGFLPQQDTGVIVAVTEAAQSISIPRMTALQAQADGDRAEGPGGHRRGVVRRRGVDQRHAEHGAVDHRFAAAPPARGFGGGDRREADAGIVGHSRIIRVHAAGAGHSDRHAHQPHAISSTRWSIPMRRSWRAGRRSWWRGCAMWRSCAMSPRTSRTSGFRPISGWIAMPPCAWA